MPEVTPLSIAAFVSGGGTNLQSIIDAIEAKDIPNAKISAVVSSNDKAYALDRAKIHGLDFAVFAKKDYAGDADRTQDLLGYLQEREIDLIVLCGSLMILPDELINAYERRIINVHPSLLPAFGGRGFYGLKVHEAVLARGVKITGATVHFVNNVIDGGEIILQRAIDVLDSDTPESLQKRVMEECERKILPLAVKMFAERKMLR